MPAKHRLGLHEQQRFASAGSTAASSVIRVRSWRRKIGRFTLRAATMSCWHSKMFSATSSPCERSRSVARPPTIEHGRGRSASRITFAALAKSVCNLAMTPASTKPICAKTSYIFKPLLGVKSSTILCRRSEVARTGELWSRQEEPADTCCGNERLFERQIMTRSGNDLER
jgi:hypothetical protein